MHCLNCGRKNYGGAGLCAQCGAPVPPAAAQLVVPAGYTHPGQTQLKSKAPLIIFAAIVAAAVIIATVTLIFSGSRGLNGLYYSARLQPFNQNSFIITSITFTDGIYVIGDIQPANEQVEPVIREAGTYSFDGLGNITLYPSHNRGGSFAYSYTIGYDSSRNVVFISGQEYRKW